MKKNAITANMWNLILAFAPNITADSMKNWLKWMMSVMTGANHPIKSIVEMIKVILLSAPPMCQ